MGLLDNYSGVGMSPRPKWQHQRVMGRLFTNMYAELSLKGYEPLTEATVTDDWDDLAPDIVVFNAKNEPLSIIEITTHKESHAIMHKCGELIARFPQAEYFVYDYEADMFYRYDPQNEEWVSEESVKLYSRYLEQPLACYLTGL